MGDQYRIVNTIQQLIDFIWIFHHFVVFLLILQQPTNNIYLVVNCSLTLCILTFIILSMIHWFITDYAQWIGIFELHNVRDAKIHLLMHSTKYLLISLCFSSLLAVLHRYWIYNLMWIKWATKQLQCPFQTNMVRHFSKFKILWWNIGYLPVLYYVTDVLVMRPFVAIGWSPCHLGTFKALQTCKMINCKQDDLTIVDLPYVTMALLSVHLQLKVGVEYVKSLTTKFEVLIAVGVLLQPVQKSPVQKIGNIHIK